MVHPVIATPETIHRGEDELPFVTLADDVRLQLVHVDLGAGVWTVRNQFPPGVTITKHRHTGHVLAFTQTGSWHYLESPEALNTAGSFLYEPAGSVHTLHVPQTNKGPTDVWFTVTGANLNLGADGRVESVIDAAAMLHYYRLLCDAEFGVSDPPVVVAGP